MTDRGRDVVEREARDAVQVRLAALSLLVWMVLALALTGIWTTPHQSLAPEYLRIGGAALVVAALPWLSYRRWVAAESRRRRARQADQGTYVAGPAAGPRTRG